MLLTITTTHSPGTALGYLLHKHPERFQSFKLSFGKAHVFYPEASQERCTVALLLDVDPVGLVRKQRGEGYQLEQYVNDRPYVASSFLSVAIAQIFGTALAGRCKDQPELAQTPIPLTAKLAVLPCKSGEAFLRRLFEPLGYTVITQQHALDEQFLDWGNSPYFTVELQATVRLQDLLSHLYVLIPVLDDEKHYWVGDEEVDKLLRHGEGWLVTHPEQQQIAKRYLKRQGRLVRTALAQLVEEDNPNPDDNEEKHELEEAIVEKPMTLNQQRLEAVLKVLKACGAKRVIDLGCGEGRLLKVLLQDNSTLSQYEERSHMTQYYVNAYRRYCWQVDSITDLKLAPFHILAIEGAVHIDKNHVWHMDAIAKICQRNTTLFQATTYKVVDVNEKASEEAGIKWWEELTCRGGEGMVVKPFDFIVKGQRGLVQPAVKCRGREYLRIIYGPEYTAPENLERLRQRGLSRKRSLALREFALGIEALERFVAKEPLRRVHECVFGILALESEPVDPRL